MEFTPGEEVRVIASEISEPLRSQFQLDGTGTLSRRFPRLPRFSTVCDYAYICILCMSCFLMCSSTFQYFSLLKLYIAECLGHPWTLRWWPKSLPELIGAALTEHHSLAKSCSMGSNMTAVTKGVACMLFGRPNRRIGPCFRVEFEDLVYWPLPHQCATKKHQQGMQHVHASLVLFFWTTLLAYPFFFQMFAYSEVTISYKFNWDHQAKVNYFDAIFQPQGPKDCRCSSWKK